MLCSDSTRVTWAPLGEIIRETSLTIVGFWVSFTTFVFRLTFAEEAITSEVVIDVPLMGNMHRI
jgi:hypothetical protein